MHPQECVIQSMANPKEVMRGSRGASHFLSHTTRQYEPRERKDQSSKAAVMSSISLMLLLQRQHGTVGENMGSGTTVQG